MPNKVDVNKILKYVGGRENIDSITHCATRLRIRLKDENKVTIDQIQTITGVLGVQKNVGEVQVIIGTTVDQVYQDFIKVAGIKQTSNESSMNQGRKGFKGIINTLFEALTGCISPIVHAFIVMGMFKSVAAIFGPSLLGWISAESDLYLLVDGIGNAITYFIPFLLAYSASQKLGANTIVSLVLASVLLSPVVMNAVTAGEPFMVFGIFPMTLVNYSSTFLPIILIVAVQVYVERVLNKIIPDILKTIFVPTLTVAIMSALGLCLLGPIGQWLGTGLANVVMWLSVHAGWLEGALVCGLYVFMVAFGLGGPVYLATFAVYMQTGMDPLYFPYMVIYGMVLAGIDLGYIIKAKKSAEKETGIVALTSQLIGNVSEPSIYGVLFRNKTCLVIEVVACAIAGFYCGLTHASVIGMTFGIPVIGSFLSFSGASSANFINGSISIVIGFILGLVGVLIFFKDNRKSNIDISAPIEGKVIPLSEVNDQTFASGMMGKGVAIVPGKGEVVSPFDGQVTMVFATKHAIGIRSNDGVEMMIHIGIDTVQLQGKYFEVFKQEGDTIKKGDVLVRFDIDAIKTAGFDVITPIIITNTQDFQDVNAHLGEVMNHDNSILTLTWGGVD